MHAPPTPGPPAPAVTLLPTPLQRQALPPSAQAGCRQSGPRGKAWILQGVAAEGGCFGLSGRGRGGGVGGAVPVGPVLEEESVVTVCGGSYEMRQRGVSHGPRMPEP